MDEAFKNRKQNNQWWKGDKRAILACPSQWYGKGMLPHSWLIPTAIIKSCHNTAAIHLGMITRKWIRLR